MYMLSKILGMLAEPANMLVFIMLFGIFLKRRSNRFFSGLGSFVLGLLVVTILTLTFVPVGQFALMPLENRYADVLLPETADGLIMLTGDENTGVSESRDIPVAGWSAQRYVKLASLAKRYPAAKIVVVGNTRQFNPSSRISTRQISEFILKSVGIPLERVKFEEASMNTYENVKNLQAMVKPAANEKWIVVTSASHLPRTMACFQKMGWKDVVPSASDYITKRTFEPRFYMHLAHNLYDLNLAAHEYYGLVAYAYMGWIDSPWL